MNSMKSQGTTRSEKYLGQLGKQAFLSLWSCLNPYRSKGQELCDMLVVFNGHALVFSVKEIEHKRGEKAEVAWARWYKKAIKASANQLFGAESWLLGHSERIFTDAACKQKTSFDFSGNIKIHKICVALGASRACREYHGDSEGLTLSSVLDGDACHTLPFVVGQPDRNRGFIHVFDDRALDRVFDEIDTSPDFVNYLTKREKFMSQNTVEACEEDLLMLYLTNANEKGEHDFVPQVPAENDMNIVMLPVGGWDDFAQSKTYRSKKAADENSYLWDKLIERFAAGKIYDENGYRTGSDSELESQLRFMAEESRLNRRRLAENLLFLWGKASFGGEGKSWVKVCSIKEYPGKAYALMAEARKEGEISSAYTKRRKSRLTTLSMATAAVFPKAEHIIGLAIEPGDRQGATEDFLVFDTRNWTDAIRKTAQTALKKEYPSLKKAPLVETKTMEYPEE